MNTIATTEFNPSLAVINGTIKTTSLKVAEHFGKQHFHVLRKIQSLECSAEFTESNFGLSEYIDESGKLNPYYEMTKDGFTFLAMGFTGKQAAQWKEAYINAFNLMAAQLQKPQYGLKELPRSKTNGITLHFEGDEPQKILVSVGPMGTTITKLLPDEEIIKKGQYYIMAKKDEVSISKLVYDFIPSRFLPIMIEVAGQRLGSLQ